MASTFLSKMQRIIRNRSWTSVERKLMNRQQPKPTTYLPNKSPALPNTVAKVPSTNERRANAQTAPFRDTIPWRLVLHIGTLVTTAVGLEIADAVIVGRHDQTLGAHPELDLTAYGAIGAGVSRRHARLFVHERGLYIQDLGSTNGTHVNGRQLQAEAPYRITDGDVIDIGELRIKLNIIRGVF
jgi:FHA domain